MKRYGFVLALFALLLQGCSWIYGEDGLFPDNGSSKGFSGVA